MALSTAKEGIRQLVYHCSAAGVRHVVFSPGSRNAPLVLGFAGKEEITAHVVPDERAAGFFALGLALATGEPVALSCTSGSAVLNYAPAVAEAFYLRVPLVVLSADRPEAWTDQGDGQTIRQRGALQPHVLYEANLLEQPGSEEERWLNRRHIQEGLTLCTGEVPGPVHFNLPLSEPLYDAVPVESTHERQRLTVRPGKHLPPEPLAQLQNIWRSASRKLILVGQQTAPNARTSEALRQLSAQPDVLIFSESTSNLDVPDAVNTIDVLINTLAEEERRQLAPDLLLVIGGAVISKKVKAWLRESSPDQIWVLDPSSRPADTYMGMTVHLPFRAEELLPQLASQLPACAGEYKSLGLGWLSLRTKRREEFLSLAPWSDLTAISAIVNALPETGSLHSGNSSAIRYLQLFRQNPALFHHANRGTSGIDGSTATAVGYAAATGDWCTLLLGDMSFLYDHNGLWVEKAPEKLRIIVINNGGGGIFRIIPGPGSTQYLSRFFEAGHGLNAQHLASAYGWRYTAVSNADELNKELPGLYDTGGPKILEVITPRLENSTVLSNFFNYLQHGK